MEDAKDSLKETELKLKPINEEVRAAKKELKKVSKSQMAHQSDIQCAQRKHEHLCQEQKEKEECRYQMAYCQHYLAWQPPGEAPEQVAFILGEEPLQLNPPTMEMSLPQAQESSPQEENQDPPAEEDVEMQDDATSGEPQGATGGAPSLIHKEEEEMLDEPQMQVTMEMVNLKVGSPSDPAKSQTETRL